MQFRFFSNQLCCLIIFMLLLLLFCFLSICMVYIFRRSLLFPNLSLLCIWPMHFLHYIQVASFHSVNIHNTVSTDSLWMPLSPPPIHTLLLTSVSILVIFFRNSFLRSVFRALLIRSNSSNGCCS